jgi:uncharacterized protein (DUF2267 family)
MAGIGKNEVPKTQAELQQEPQFWVESLRRSKLTTEQRATLIAQLPHTLHDQETKELYLKGWDELLKIYERNVNNLERDMAKGTEQNVVDHEQLRLKGNDEGEVQRITIKGPISYKLVSSIFDK